MKLPSCSRFNFAAFAVAYLFLTTSCWAGGSIGWDEVRAKIVKDDPFLADYIAKNFELSPSGGGIRVGHDKDGNSLVPGLAAGERIPPYEFSAKPLGTPGEYTLYLTFDTSTFGKDQTPLWFLTLRKRLPSD